MNQTSLVAVGKRVATLREKFGLFPHDGRLSVDPESLVGMFATPKPLLIGKAVMSKSHFARISDLMCDQYGITKTNERGYSTVMFASLVVVILGTDRLEDYINQIGGVDHNISDYNPFQDQSFADKLSQILADEYPKFDEFLTALKDMGLKL